MGKPDSREERCQGKEGQADIPGQGIWPRASHWGSEKSRLAQELQNPRAPALSNLFGILIFGDLGWSHLSFI